MAPRFWDVIRDNIGSRAGMADWWRLMTEGATPDVAAEDADFVREALSRLPEPPWDEATWPAWTAAVKDATGRKGRALFMPLRHALTGRTDGPDMAALMPLLQVKPKV